MSGIIQQGFCRFHQQKGWQTNIKTFEYNTVKHQLMVVIHKMISWWYCLILWFVVNKVFWQEIIKIHNGCLTSWHGCKY